MGKKKGREIEASTKISKRTDVVGLCPDESSSPPPLAPPVREAFDESEALSRDYEHHCRDAARQAFEKPEVESVSGSIKQKMRKTPTSKTKRGSGRERRGQAARQIESSDKAASRPRNY